MLNVLLTHLLVGLALLVAGRPLGRRAFLVGAVAPVAALAWLAGRLGAVLDGDAVRQHVTWIPVLDLGVEVRIDGFAALLVLVVAGIGVGVFVYAHGYFDSEADAERAARLAGLLVLFSGAMLGVVSADNVLVLYGAWELTSVLSFLLVGDRFRDPAARAAATQAILVTGAGGLCLLLGLIMLGRAAGTYRLSAILAEPPSGTVTGVALVLVAIGAFTKSAQYPFHGWLPGAMVAPTPISAYLHSATMVKAGVYLIARFAPAFAATAPAWRWLVVGVGLWSMVAGGVRALREHDLKVVLAFGTISQLGFMVALFGLGLDATTFAACAVLAAHAVFKAALFMVVGVVDHGFGTRDVRAIPRQAGPGWRGTRAVAVLSALSMAGVPFTLGFVAKEAALAAAADGGVGGTAAVTVALVVGSALTAAYSFRVAAGVLGRLEVPAGGAGHEEAAHEGAVPEGAVPEGADAPHAPAATFVAVPLLLAGLTVAFGLAPGPLDALVGASAASLVGSAVPKHLAAWHGINLALGLSAVALATGAVLFEAGRRGRLPWRRVRRLPSGDALYHGSVAAITATAARVTGLVQVGSMPVYLGVILTTVTVVPLAVLVAGGGLAGDWPTLVDHGAQVPIVAVMLGAAIGTAVLRHRLSVALLLGVVGYAMAGLFVVHGAPDLALTQAAVETLTTVLFVLTLRRLPTRFERRSTRATRWLRIAVSTGVGVTVFALALAAAQNPLARVVSGEMVARSLPDANGANVVNVILVDFRGWTRSVRSAWWPWPPSARGPGPGRSTAFAGHPFGRRGAARRRSGRRPAAGPAGTVRHVFVDAVVRVLVLIALVVSVYLLVAGHNDPGGGFVGGLVAGAAVALRYIAGGIDDVRSMVRPQPWTILGAGLVTAAVTAAVPVLFGRPVLDNGYWTIDPPLLDPIGVSSALAFDLGVYLVVVGLVFMAFEAFGDEPRRFPS
ncbi:MAG: hydrogen gas-evolving membrane-bound hydrogenase subunit E [Acidimicrobiales bacterium]